MNNYDRRLADTLKDQLAKNIRKIRKQLKLSQQQLAESADLSVKQISNIENNKVDIKTSTLIKIAQALDVHPMYLYFDDLNNTLPFSYKNPELILNKYLDPSIKVREPSGSTSVQHESVNLYEPDRKDTPELRYQYQMILESKWDAISGVLQSYGIVAYGTQNGEPTILDAIKNISSDSNFIANAVHKMNSNDLDIVHFHDVIEDMLI